MKSDANSALPILSFHALDESESVIALAPRQFEHLLSHLNAAGWYTISLRAAVENLRARKPNPPRAFVITFDDGYESVYTRAFPLLQKFGMTATVFVTTGIAKESATATRLPALNGCPLLSWLEMRAMQNAGIEFGAHTLTHPDLTRLDDADIEHELRASQAILAEALGAAVTTFAYPFGRYDARSRNIATRFFDCACSDKLGLANAQSDTYALERVDAYYMRSAWTQKLITGNLFAWYLRARNVPRRFRRMLFQ